MGDRLTARCPFCGYAARGCCLDEALYARPLPGPIDYAGLTREHLARHPKIRARLAE